MQFRWIAIITLWTCVAGPIFGGRSTPSSRPAVTVPANGPHTWHSSSEKRR